jgi:glycosyltransferase involved in cell wall biosynthesis/ubiquinone/menaquinone biosynthesis C-methylase UbiE
MMGKGPLEKLPKVTVVIPMMNEKAYIGKCLESILTQDYPHELVEILVVDGGSRDGSIEIVEGFVAGHENVRLLGGVGVNCPAAMNVGIRHAAGSVVAKVDAHGYIAKDFLSRSVDYLTRTEDVKCVGGFIEAVPETTIGKANALARCTRFGVGEGFYSSAREARFADTVQCGVYEKSTLEEVGLFDETLQFGEDEEINWRIRKGGYRIFVTPEIKFFYFPRSTFSGLFRQYFNYGRSRVRVIQKYPDFFRVKHAMPAMLTLFLFVTAMLSFVSNLFSILFVAGAAGYLSSSLYFSSLIGKRFGWRYFALLPFSFGALHLGYGSGFCCGMYDILFSGKVENDMYRTLGTMYFLNGRLGVERFLRGINYWRCIEYPWVAHHLETTVDHRILDVGSSSCSPLVLFLASLRKYTVHATDVDEGVMKNLEFAKRLGLEDQIRQNRLVAERMDGTALCYQDEAFDRVTAVSTLEHIPEDGDTKAIQEIARVLKGRGRAVITVPYAFRYAEEFVMADMYDRVYAGEPVFYQRRYDQKALKKRLIAPSGLKVKEIAYFGERSIQFEKMWGRLPLPIKAMVGWMMPVISILLLQEMRGPVGQKAKACFMVFEKP